jgi:exodeoxyribonuclease VII large subunit
VYLKGEVSNFKYHASGHFYFTLKDEASQISAVMFKKQASNIPFKLENGMTVLVEGFISLYLVSGQYQINISSMQLDGVGDLYLKYEQLKEKLAKKGYFDPQYKKAIVPFPNRIAVITSDTGAAIRDIISTIERRYKACEVIVFPTLVQGEFAKKAIVESIQAANLYGGIDTIILGRGGGSIEDLWNFNEEDVATAIFNSEIPIISAVGHETDFTISDFVSDVRAATPTAAAEIAVPNTRDVINFIEQIKQRMNQNLFHKLNQIEKNLKRIHQSFVFQTPNRLFEQHYFKSDRLQQRLEASSPKAFVSLSQEKLTSMQRQLDDRYKWLVKSLNQRFTHLIEKLEFVNPLNLLTKGYSIVKKADVTINRVTDVEINDQLSIILTDGTLSVLVNSKDGSHERD